MDTERTQVNQTVSEELPISSVTEEGFSIRLEKFEKSYLWLVIGCSCGAAAAIVMAVFLRVSIGLVAAIGVAVAYRLLLSKLLKQHLGLTCNRNSDGVTVSVVGAWGEFWIPARLLWLDVTEVRGACEAACLHLPRSVKRIGVLKNEGSSMRILYEGSAEEWSALAGSEALDAAKLVCDSAYPQKPVRARKVNK